MIAFHFLDGAIIELEEAAAYYERQAMQLSVDLRDEIDCALNFLSGFQHAAKPIDKIYRSYKLHRFPYLLIHRIEGRELVIVAVAHAAREEGYWRGRPDGAQP